MATPGEIFWTQSIITSATNTAVIDISALDGVDSSSYVEVLELSVSVFVAAASTTLRFEADSGGTAIAAFGAANGTAIGDVITRNFSPVGYKLGANIDLNCETVGASCTWYVAVKYRLVIA